MKLVQGVQPQIYVEESKWDDQKHSKWLDLKT